MTAALTPTLSQREREQDTQPSTGSALTPTLSQREREQDTQPSTGSALTPTLSQGRGSKRPLRQERE
jgi:hypothetical protein